MKQITMTIDVVNKILTEKVAYHPHRECKKGNVYLTGAGGKEGKDDSCVIIHPQCRIDITDDVYIGRYVNISSGARLLTHEHDYSGRKPLLLKEMLEEKTFTIPYEKKIEDDVWIFKSVILAKCQHIAKGVIIGVGSIVTKNIEEEYSIWAGNPAKKIGMR